MASEDARPPVVQFALRILDASELPELLTICTWDMVSLFGADHACVVDDEGTTLAADGTKDTSHQEWVFQLSKPGRPKLALKLQLQSQPDLGIIRQQFLDLVAMIRGALSRFRVLEERSREASLDPLTEVPNRRHLDTFLAQAVEDTVSGKSEAVVVMLIDLDDFKRVNDTFGHASGDSVLQTVAESMRSMMRNVDTIGRWGGDEFVAILPNTRMRDASVIAGRLRRAFADHPSAKGCTLSIGVASTNAFTKEAVAVAELIELADRLMYENKKGSGNAVTCSPIRRNPEFEGQLGDCSGPAVAS